MAEEFFLQSGLDVTILKPDFIYGRGGKGFMTLVNVIRNSRMVPIPGDGTYRRQPIHVDDAALAFFRALKDEAIGKTYIIAGREPIGFNQMVGMIMDKLAVKKRTVHIPIWIMLLAAKMMKAAKNPRLTQTVVLGIAQDRAADISPMINELGINPVSFGEGLKKSL